LAALSLISNLLEPFVISAVIRARGKWRKSGFRRPHDTQARFGKIPALSRKKNPKTGRRRNLGTFPSRSAAEKHEHEVQHFKRH
jgi:hypothetical protein